MSYYDEMKTCSKCDRKTKSTHRRSEKTNERNKARGAPRRQLNCDDCEAPKKCHAQIGIGVATLGADCCYDEGHDGPHSYYPKTYYGCNKHKHCKNELA